MAEEQGSQERTEQATPRKKRESRKKGMVARSVELNSAFVLLAGTAVLYFGGHQISSGLFGFSKEIFTLIPSFQATQQSSIHLLSAVFFFVMKALAPLTAVIFVAGVAINAAQVGFVLSGEALVPKLDRLDPIAGFGRLFSGKSVVEVLKSIVKFAVIGYIAYVTIKGAYSGFIILSDSGISAAAGFMNKTLFTLLFRCVTAIFVLAAFDYVYERWAYEKKLKMSKQELKEELKHSEGNPQTKSRIRSMQQKVARARMMQQVPKADVVIRNPTHFAVAVRYDVAKMKAPQVVAKGTMLVAQKIIEVAKAHHVPIVENKPLAQTLYKSVDIGGEIPANLYKAVAEILAYVYQLKHKGKKNAGRSN